MKQIPKFSFIFFFLLIFSSNSYALDRMTCADYSKDAKSELGTKYIYARCLSEIKKGTNWLNRSKEYKCAFDAGEATNDTAAEIIYRSCMKNK